LVFVATNANILVKYTRKILNRRSKQLIMQKPIMVLTQALSGKDEERQMNQSNEYLL
jgi:hypothetical protein